MTVVFSRRQAETISHPDAPERRYTIAPLTWQERAAYRAELTRVAGVLPARGQLADALRRACRELSPGNADELLDAIAAGEAAGNEVAEAVKVGVEPPPEATDVIARLQTIERAAMAFPPYADMVAAQQHWLSIMPWVSAQFALRGWEGEGLPEFRRVRGVVPAELLDDLPPDEVEFIGWKAADLMSPNKAAVGNSASPSPSRSIPALATAESGPTTEAAGS